MKKPKISVIIPSYNHEKYINESVQSVLNQTYQDFELIITDDGSTDKTVSKIKEFKDKRIKLFTFKKNRGGVIATHNCLHYAQGEYIAFLNSDDTFLPNKLERQLKYLSGHPHVAAVFSYVEVIDENSKTFTDKNHFYYNIFRQLNRSRYKWLNYFFNEGNCLCYPSVMMPKKTLKETGPLDSRYVVLTDFDYWIKICLKNEIHIIQEKLIKFRVRNDNKNISGDNPKAKRRVVYEYSKILNNFLSTTNQNDFFKIFPEIAKFYSPNTKHNLSFLLAQLAIKKDSIPHQNFGINILFDLLKDKKTATEINKKYHFSFIDFIKKTGELNLFNLNLDNIRKIKENEKKLLSMSNEVKSFEERLKELKKENSALNRILNKITSSKTYKIWQTYCRIRDNIIEKIK